MKQTLGVNICGFIDGEFGLGEGVRATIRALETQNILMAINKMNIKTSHRHQDDSYPNISSENPFPINIIQFNGDVLPNLQQGGWQDYLKNKYNIGYWSWELPDFPQEWSKALYALDEIWTPSNFCVDAFSQNSSIPVLRMPHSIHIPESSQTRRDLKLPEDKFIFLFMFDFFSIFERKNPLAVIEAFRQAFGDDERVFLILKSINGKQDSGNFQIMNKAAENAGNVKIIDDVWDRKDVWGLVRNCDCYVSLHRSEGFGLSIAEAMFCGKPTIATAYSANAEYLNVNNGFPVRYTIETLENDCGHYKKGNVWAAPDVNHAAKLMRRVFEFPEEAKEIGHKAAIDAPVFFGKETVGSRMRRRLEYIDNLRSSSEETERSSKKHIQTTRTEQKINSQAEAITNLEKHIKAMEESRFWKIRNYWFRLKSFLRRSNNS